MVAGTPAFAAINDYQSFRKIEALDYTFPDGFYEVARDLTERLLVRNDGTVVLAPLTGSSLGPGSIKSAWCRA